MTATTQARPGAPAPHDGRPELPSVAEHRGEAMGSTMHIVATGRKDLVDMTAAWAVKRVDELELLWSRFIATSEVSQLNANPGTPVAVSGETITLIERAIEARQLSHGQFDPTLLQAMHANGYDRTFVSIKMPAGLPAINTQRIGLGEMTIDHHAQTVTLGATTGFDPGGIGKGLAADLVAQEMMDRGIAGALVNIGGDVRCIGHGPADGTWVISVGDDIAGVENQVFEISEGGIATSTKARRRWLRQTTAGLVDSHHLLDPATGESSTAAATLVTVIAACCGDAEWLATSIAASGALPADRSIVGAASVVLTKADGRVVTAGSPETFMR